MHCCSRSALECSAARLVKCSIVLLLIIIIIAVPLCNSTVYIKLNIILDLLIVSPDDFQGASFFP